MPVVKQLSIFLENKPGVLARLCEAFAEHRINIEGLTVSDTVDHAVVRLITDDADKAHAMLESAGVLVVETDVLALRLPDKPGQLALVAGKLSRGGVNIEYAYGTASKKGGTLVLRVSDIKKAKRILKA